jgi:hypothetical protein
VKAMLLPPEQACDGLQQRDPACHMVRSLQALKARDIQGAEEYVRGTSEIQVPGGSRTTSILGNVSLLHEIRVHMPNSLELCAFTTLRASSKTLFSGIWHCPIGHDHLRLLPSLDVCCVPDLSFHLLRSRFCLCCRSTVWIMSDLCTHRHLWMLGCTLSSESVPSCRHGQGALSQPSLDEWHEQLAESSSTSGEVDAQDALTEHVVSPKTCVTATEDPLSKAIKTVRPQSTALPSPYSGERLAPPGRSFAAGLQEHITTTITDLRCARLNRSHSDLTHNTRAEKGIQLAQAARRVVNGNQALLDHPIPGAFWSACGEAAATAQATAQYHTDSTGQGRQGCNGHPCSPAGLVAQVSCFYCVCCCHATRSMSA